MRSARSFDLRISREESKRSGPEEAGLWGSSEAEGGSSSPAE